MNAHVYFTALFIIATPVFRHKRTVLVEPTLCVLEILSNIFFALQYPCIYKMCDCVSACARFEHLHVPGTIAMINELIQDQKVKL